MSIHSITEEAESLLSELRAAEFVSDSKRESALALARKLAQEARDEDHSPTRKAAFRLSDELTEKVKSLPSKEDHVRSDIEMRRAIARELDAKELALYAPRPAVVESPTVVAPGYGRKIADAATDAISVGLFAAAGAAAVFGVAALFRGGSADSDEFSS